MTNELERIIESKIGGSLEPRSLEAIIKEFEGPELGKDSTDVKLAIFSLVRQGKAVFDQNWQVQAVSR